MTIHGYDNDGRILFKLTKLPRGWMLTSLERGVPARQYRTYEAATHAADSATTLPLMWNTRNRETS
jgi:hypothetical protein